MSTEQQQLEIVMLRLTNTPNFEPWARVCLQLLSQTDGLERYTDIEDDDPHVEFLKIANRALEQNNQTKLLEMSKMAAFEYRAMATDTHELWNPLDESLNQFEARQKAPVHVWKSWNRDVSPEDIEKWIKRRVFS